MLKLAMMFILARAVRKIAIEFQNLKHETCKDTHHAAAAKAFNQAPNRYPPLLICNSIYGTAPV